MWILVGFLISNQVLLQFEVVWCLYEFFYFEQFIIVEVCLLVIFYFFIYFFGYSLDFIELCLYILGNLIVESEVVRRQFLLQGIVLVLVVCIQFFYVVVLEVFGYVLFQFLQVKEVLEKIIFFILVFIFFQYML